ncbi:zf-HC2 domain-containing protein [Spirochaetota bacterium]
MKDKIIHKLIETEPCKDDYEELVGALADGSPLTDEEKDKVIDHLGECDSCRYFLESFFLMKKAEKQNTDTPFYYKVPIQVAAEGLMPIDNTYTQNYPQAYVLSKKSTNILEFKFPVEDDTISIKIIKLKKGISIEIDAVDKKSRYYLIKGNDFKIASPRDGIVNFENISEGDFIISEDLKSFISLKFTG